MARHASSAAAIALLVVACNGLTGVGALDAVDESSTSGGGDAAVDQSSGTDGSSGGDGGALGDSGAIDISDDGGTDASSDADAAPPLGYCASLPAGTADVCTDFDDNVFPGPWTQHPM